VQNSLHDEAYLLLSAFGSEKVSLMLHYGRRAIKAEIAGDLFSVRTWYRVMHCSLVNDDQEWQDLLQGQRAADLWSMFNRTRRLCFLVGSVILLMVILFVCTGQFRLDIFMIIFNVVMIHSLVFHHAGGARIRSFFSRPGRAL